MDSREKKKLKRQLEAQIVTLEKQEGASLAVSVVTACRGLLKMAGEVPIAQFTESEFQELYASYLSLAKCVENFHNEASSRLKKDSASNEKNEVADRLKRALAEVSANRMSLDAAEREWKEVKAANLKLESEIADLKNAIQNEKKRSVTLENSRSGMLAKAEAQKKNNEAILALAEEQKNILAQLQKNEEELLLQNEKIQADIEKTQAAIAAMPEENAVLLGQYEEKAAALEKLRRAKTDCSPAVQASLEEQITELVPVVEELQTSYDVLSGRLHDLKARKIHFDRENQTLASNILTLTESALSSLSHVLDEHHEALTEVQKTADILSEKTKRCLELRDGYRDWFGVQETPLAAMIRATALPESASLKETLDIGTLNTVKTLMENVGNDLESLDRILQACSAAVREDRQNVLRRTHI